MMVQLDDHRLPDGSINWDSLRQAELDAGQRCTSCHQAIIFGSGGPSRCSNCKDIDNAPGRIEHSRRIRCPSCRRVENVEEHSIWGEGEHRVACAYCDHHYTVNTRCLYYFESPELIPSATTTDDTEE